MKVLKIIGGDILMLLSYAVSICCLGGLLWLSVVWIFEPLGRWIGIPPAFGIDVVYTDTDLEIWNTFIGFVSSFCVVWAASWYINSVYRRVRDEV